MRTRLSSLVEGDLEFVGEGLDRAECVLVTASGDIFCADHVAGVVQLGHPRESLHGVPKGFLPNGIAMLPGRRFLVANMSPESGGGVWEIDARRHLKPWLMEAEGELLWHANFVLLDHQGRVWITVSTRTRPRQLAYRNDMHDGFVVMVDEKGARIVADGLGYTNECRVDPSGRWLYVVETFGRCLSRFEILGDRLGPRSVVAEFDGGDFPDGFAFDVEGAVWVACVVSNRVLRISRHGHSEVVVDGSDPVVIERAEAQFAVHAMGRTELDLGLRSPLGNVSSVAFAGGDLRRVVLGSLGNRRLTTFRTEVAGAPPAHWLF